MPKEKKSADPVSNLTNNPPEVSPPQGTPSQNPSSVSPATSQKGMSTGAKIAIGCGIGCVVLIIILVIVSIFGAALIRKAIPEGTGPEFMENWLESSIEDGTGGSADVNIDENKWTFTDDNGETSMEYGEGVELPSDFPSDVPVYSGATVTGKTTSTDGSTVSFSTDDSVSKVSSFYKKELEDEGWTEISTYESTDSIVLSYEKDEQQLSLSIYGDSSGTSFVIIYDLPTDE